MREKLSNKLSRQSAKGKVPKLEKKLPRKSRSDADKLSGSAAGKRDNFVRLAQSRTINAIKAIRVIGKLSNKAAYEFDEADVRKIVAALNREVELLKVRMASPGTKETIEFKL